MHLNDFNEVFDSIQLFIQKYLLLSSIDSTPSSEAAEKYARHQRESQPIISDLLTPYEAFKEGFESAIASFIKLGQEDRLKISFNSEILPKSKETELLEYLILNLFEDFNSVKFIKFNEEYVALARGHLYQFSTLLKKANFNQIHLSHKELESYQILSKSELYQQPHINAINGRPSEDDFKKLDPENICEALSFPEKEAINIYTGDLYLSMNHLMRGNIEEAFKNQTIFPEITTKGRANHCIKEILLHIAVTVSALNKLPDYQAPETQEGYRPQYLYRIEQDLPQTSLNMREWAVLQGGGITTEMGFISTSFWKPAENFFNENTRIGVLIKNCKGKKITPLSQLGECEREVLLPPTQLQWLYVKEIFTNTGKNHMKLFIAQPVTVHPELALDFVPLLVDDWLIERINPKDIALFESILKESFACFL